MARKVLVISASTAVNNSAFTVGATYAASVLRRMGYEVDMMSVLNSSTWMDGFTTSNMGYEFVVIPRAHTGWSNAKIQIFGNGTAVIPTFIIGMREYDVNFINVLGLTRVASSAYLKSTWVSASGGTFEYPMYAAQYTISAPFSGITIPLAYSTDTPTNVIAAKFIGAQSNTYIDCENLSYGNLPFLMEHAIADGQIAAPSKSIPIAVDVDDMPQTVTHTTTLAECEDLYNLQLAYNMPITWGFHANAPNYTYYQPDVLDFLKARTPDKGGLIYLIDHGNDDWRAASSTIQSTFETYIANMQSLGLITGETPAARDNWGYRYFNINQLGENGLQLIESTYGHVAVRASQAKADGASKAIRTSDTDPFPNIQRGVRIIPGNNGISSSMHSLDYATDIATFAAHLNNAYGKACKAPFIAYLHGDNFWGAENGNNAPGLIALRALGNMCTSCPSSISLVHGSRVQ